MRKKIFVVILSLVLFVTLSQTALAVSWWPLVPCGLNAQPKDSNGVELPKVPTQENPDAHDYTQPCNRCDLFKLLKNIIDFVLIGLMPPAAAILFVWGGFLILMGGANPGLISKGKTIFWNTAIGVAIVSASWLITNSIIRSIGAETVTVNGVVKNVAADWWKFQCGVTTAGSPVEPPVQPPAGGNCSGVQCSDSNLNVCGQNTSANCSESAVNRWDSQIRAAAVNNQVGSGINTIALVKAIMSQESGGRTDQTSFDGTSHGIMQIRPETADQFKSGCTSANITSGWLKDPNNVQASICISINYMKSLIGPCGTEIKNIAAGYNGGGAAKGACGASASCASCSMCGSEQTRRWECLWDGPDGEHKLCNAIRRDSTTGKFDNFSQTRRYAPSVAYCYTKFGGSSGNPPGGGTGNLTLSSIEPSIFPAGTEKSFNQETGVVEYTYLEAPFEIKGSNLTGTILLSDDIGIDGKPGIEFKNLQTTGASVRGTMLLHPTAKGGNTRITVKNSDSSADIQVTVTMTGTQYLKRKFADNPKISFRGNWKETMPSQTILDIEDGVRRGADTISTDSYKRLDINEIIYEEKFFDDKFICGRPSPGKVINGCASPQNNIIKIKANSDNPPKIAMTTLHEAAHKLHFFNLGDYRGIPNAPTTLSKFQSEWDAFNVVTPVNTSACSYMPLQNSVTWKDGTSDSAYCVFFRAYGASTLPGDSFFYEDPTTMTESYFQPKALSGQGYEGKINLLKKYGFLP